jgi:hypothetical protein
VCISPRSHLADQHRPRRLHRVSVARRGTSNDLEPHAAMLNRATAGTRADSPGARSTPLPPLRLPCVDEKEPGFWVRWAAGIVAAVLGGVLVAVLAGVFKGSPGDAPPTATSIPTPKPGPNVRITVFSTASASAGEYPKATFKVYNAGNDTADRCRIEWHPFDANLNETPTAWSSRLSSPWSPRRTTR